MYVCMYVCMCYFKGSVNSFPAFYLKHLKMSTQMNDYEKKKLAFRLNVTEPPFEYLSKGCVDKFSIALAIEIPFPLLFLWYNVVGLKDHRGDTIDYIDLLNGCIPNKWFQISRASGYRIEGSLRREAGNVASKLRKATGSYKKQQLNSKIFSLSIFGSEMVNVGDVKEMEYELHDARNKEKEAKDILEEWRTKYADLEKDKKAGGN